MTYFESDTVMTDQKVSLKTVADAIDDIPALGGVMAMEMSDTQARPIARTSTIATTHCSRLKACCHKGASAMWKYLDDHAAAGTPVAVRSILHKCACRPDQSWLIGCALFTLPLAYSAS